MLKPLLHFLLTSFLFIFLTLLTQIGGVVFILTKIISANWRLVEVSKWRKVGLFFSLYFLSTFLLVPPIAKHFGRVPLPIWSGQIKPTNLLTCLLNRHYVRPKLKVTCEEIASKLQQKYPYSELRYLDANFPFQDGFPLLPHLSHNDGKKLDLSFFYLEKDGTQTNSKPSVSGYGVLEKPQKGEYNTATHCKQKGYWQYSYPQWLTFGIINQLDFDVERTKYLTKAFATHTNIGKVFIEPHLKARLGLGFYSKIRFHGCQAVRHDDHIHVQL